MPSTHARSTGDEPSTDTRLGKRLHEDLIKPIGKDRAEQAAALGVDVSTLIRWLGGANRNLGAAVTAVEADRVAALLGTTQDKAWTTAPLAPPRRTRTRDPRRSTTARKAALARWSTAA